MNEPNQNEIDGELNDMVPEIVNGDAVNEDEIESVPDNIHNDGGEDENTDDLMRDKALSQQQYDEQQHALRQSGRLQEPNIRYRDDIQVMVDAVEPGESEANM